MIFANIFSCLFQTRLTFQTNISSYHESSADRFVWTCAAGTLHTNSGAPFDCVHLLWHFDAPRFTPWAAHQGQLSIPSGGDCWPAPHIRDNPNGGIKVCSPTYGQQSSPYPQTCLEHSNNKNLQSHKVLTSSVYIYLYIDRDLHMDRVKGRASISTSCSDRKTGLTVLEM